MVKKINSILIMVVIVLIAVSVLVYFYFIKNRNTSGEGWVLSPDKNFWVDVGKGLGKVKARKDGNNKKRFVYCLEISDETYSDVDGCKSGEKALFAIVSYNDEELEESEKLPLFSETDEVFVRTKEGINYSFQRPQGVLLEYDYPKNDTFYYEVIESFELAK